MVLRSGISMRDGVDVMEMIVAAADFGPREESAVKTAVKGARQA